MFMFIYNSYYFVFVVNRGDLPKLSDFPTFPTPSTSNISPPNNTTMCRDSADFPSSRILGPTRSDTEDDMFEEHIPGIFHFTIIVIKSLTICCWYYYLRTDIIYVWTRYNCYTVYVRTFIILFPHC